MRQHLTVDDYIREVWGDDGGAVATTAGLGSVAPEDLRVLREEYGMSPEEEQRFARALVAECRRRVEPRSR